MTTLGDYHRGVYAAGMFWLGVLVGGCFGASFAAVLVGSIAARRRAADV